MLQGTPQPAASNECLRIAFVGHNPACGSVKPFEYPPFGGDRVRVAKGAEDPTFKCLSLRLYLRLRSMTNCDATEPRGTIRGLHLSSPWRKVS